MQNLFALLSARYPRAAQCAAALGMTRQSYSQAQQRRRLSESKAMLAAILLEIDPAQALLANYTAANDPTAPELDTTDNPTPQPPTPPTLYYVNYMRRQKRINSDPPPLLPADAKPGYLHHVMHRTHPELPGHESDAPALRCNESSALLPRRRCRHLRYC